MKQMTYSNDQQRTRRVREKGKRNGRDFKREQRSEGKEGDPRLSILGCVRYLLSMRMTPNISRHTAVEALRVYSN